MTYDPRCDGAKCDQCPLGPSGALRSFKDPWKPVKAEHHKNSGKIAVDSAPTKDDERTGHPFSSSETGGPWLRALNSLGQRRHEYSITNVIACRPSGPVNGAYARMEDKLKKLNKVRAKQGEALLPHPEECCRPRLLKDVEPYDNIITLGKRATTALTGVRRGIKKVRGSPWGVDENWSKVAHDDETAVRKLLPTYNPGYIHRSPAYFDRWIHDISKFNRLAHGKLKWEEPADVLWRPTPDQLEAWIKSIQPTTHKDRTENIVTKPIICYDVETPRHRQGMRPTKLDLRTIAFARWQDGVERGPIELCCISLLSTDGHTKFYNDADEARIIELCVGMLEDENILKIGHNAAMFDRLVMEAQWNCTPKPLLDTIFPARAVNPSIPKGLKPTGRHYTDVGEWDSDEKEESIATGTTDDDELLRYNGTDVQVNLAMWPDVRDLATNTGYFTPINEALMGQWWPHDHVPSLFEIDQHRQDRFWYCHMAGIWIDQSLRATMQEAYTKEYEYVWERLQQLLIAQGVYLKEADIAGDNLNPNSTKHLRWLFFEKWDLIPLWESGLKDDDGKPLYSKKAFLTSNGDLSTGDEVLRSYIASGVLEDYQAEIMQLIRIFRRIRQKIVGTTLKPLAPEEPIYKKNGDLKGYTKSFLYDDDKIHCNWGVQLTNVGRANCRGPNCYSGDTEVLTDKGWIRFDELDESNLPKFVAWSPDGPMKWERATAYHKYEDAEFMSIKTDLYIDLMVTPHHRCPLFSRKRGNKFKVVEAADFPRDAKQPVAGVMKEGWTLPAARVKFIVALQADGQITDYHVRFGFSKKRKIERLRGILNDLGLNFVESPYGKVTEFRIPYSNNPDLAKLWKGCLTEQQTFDWTLLKLSAESRRVFCDEVMLWDGCSVSKRQYASKHKVNADIVQAVCNITGSSARVRRHVNGSGSVSWQTDVRWGNTTVGVANNVKKQEPNQTAYCVTVPSTFLMVRRNRVSMVSGNTMNIGNKKGQGPLKTVFAAEPGMIFYGADINQAHLFIIANEWKIPALCESMRKGYDPHNYNAMTTFGKAFTGAPGYNGLKVKPDPGSKADAMRNTIKVFIYASVYGASPATVWRVLTATEFDLMKDWHRALAAGKVNPKTGKRYSIYEIIAAAMPYMHMKPSEVVKLHEAWLRGQPEWEEAWQREQDFYRNHGYVKSYLFGRRSGNLGDEVNKIVNFGVLATESELMAIIEGQIEAAFPRGMWRGHRTGFFYQCHDSAAVKQPLPPGFNPLWSPGKKYKRADLPKEIRENEEKFEAAFTVNIPHWEFPIFGEASTGRTLKDVT